LARSRCGHREEVAGALGQVALERRGLPGAQLAGGAPRRALGIGGRQVRGSGGRHGRTSVGASGGRLTRVRDAPRTPPAAWYGVSPGPVPASVGAGPAHPAGAAVAAVLRLSQPLVDLLAHGAHRELLG